MRTNSGVHDKGTIDLNEILSRMRQNAHFHKVGAIAAFVGVVRDENPEGEVVQKLELEAYEEKANEVLAVICRDLKKRPGIVNAQIHHMIGKFDVGEDLVYVLVAGEHRGNVFSALKEAVDRYKTEAPIFKKEVVLNRQGKRKAYWITEHASPK